MASTATTQKIGQIVQVIGSTFDGDFEAGHVPNRIGHGTMATEVES